MILIKIWQNGVSLHKYDQYFEMMTGETIFTTLYLSKELNLNNTYKYISSEISMIPYDDDPVFKNGINLYKLNAKRNRLHTILNQMKWSMIKINNKNSQGTGFFCHIPINNKDIPILITSSHIIDETIIKNNKEIKVTINDKEEKNININNRLIIISKKYNVTIIEIKPDEDNICYFLDIDSSYLNKNSNFFNEAIYIIHYHKFIKEQKACVSFGYLRNKANSNDIIYSCYTNLRSLGSPILRLSNNKVIGIHHEGKNSIFTRNIFKEIIKEYLNKKENIKDSNNIFILDYKNEESDIRKSVGLEREIEEDEYKERRTILGPETGIGYINHNRTITNITNTTILGPETTDLEIGETPREKDNNISNFSLDNNIIEPKNLKEELPIIRNSNNISPYINLEQENQIEEKKENLSQSESQNITKYGPELLEDETEEENNNNINSYEKKEDNNFQKDNDMKNNKDNSYENNNTNDELTRNQDNNNVDAVKKQKSKTYINKKIIYDINNYHCKIMNENNFKNNIFSDNYIYSKNINNLNNFTNNNINNIMNKINNNMNKINNNINYINNNGTNINYRMNNNNMNNNINNNMNNNRINNINYNMKINNNMNTNKNMNINNNINNNMNMNNNINNINNINMMNINYNNKNINKSDINMNNIDKNNINNHINSQSTINNIINNNIINYKANQIHYNNNSMNKNDYNNFNVINNNNKINLNNSSIINNNNIQNFRYNNNIYNNSSNNISNNMNNFNNSLNNNNMKNNLNMMNMDNNENNNNFNNNSNTFENNKSSSMKSVNINKGDNKIILNESNYLFKRNTTLNSNDRKFINIMDNNMNNNIINNMPSNQNKDMGTNNNLNFNNNSNNFMNNQKMNILFNSEIKSNRFKNNFLNKNFNQGNNYENNNQNNFNNFSNINQINNNNYQKNNNMNFISMLSNNSNEKTKTSSFSNFNLLKVGIKNLENNSYVNSVLFLFLNIPTFTKFFLNKEIHISFYEKDFPLSLEFEKLFFYFYTNLEQSFKQSFEPTNFMKILKLNNVEQNPSKAIIFFFETLHKELNTAKNNTNMILNPDINDLESVKRCGIENFVNFNNSIISNQMNFFETVESKCTKCNSKIYNFLTSNNFKLDILGCYEDKSNRMNRLKNRIKIKDCFFYHRIINKETKFCNICKMLNPMKKISNLLSSSNLFLFILDRGNSDNFDYIPFELEEKIDLSNIIESEESPSKYELFGVISATLKIDDYAYVCFCKSPIDKKWYYYDNEIIEETQIDLTISLNDGSQYIPLILLYKSF